MQTKGKFYIWLNEASVSRWFWKQSAQNWTSIASEATFFDTEAEAQAEAEAAQAYCDEHSMGEAIVDQATKDLPDQAQRDAIFERTSMLNAINIG